MNRYRDLASNFDGSMVYVIVDSVLQHRLSPAKQRAIYSIAHHFKRLSLKAKDLSVNFEYAFHPHQQIMIAMPGIKGNKGERRKTNGTRFAKGFLSTPALTQP